MKIAVLGAGMIGRTIALDLAKNFSITSFDLNPNALEILHNSNPSIQTQTVDLSLFDNYSDLFAPFNLIVSAVPGFMGFNTLKALINLGKPIADISFFPENALDLHQMATDKNIPVVVDCGVAPGMSNLILGFYNSQMKVDSFECFVGGLPKQRLFPFEYKAPFSPVDVIEEYTRPAMLKENGFIISKPALSEAELLNFTEVGTLEAFNTDGLRSLLHTLPHIPNMKEKTLRYPGHIRWIKGLMQAGFFSKDPILINGSAVTPIEVTNALLFNQWKLQEDDAEFTIMKIRIMGEDKSGYKKIECSLYHENDPVTKLSSMSTTTGYTCTAMVHLLSQQKINKKGILPPEIIGADEDCYRFIIDHLSERGINYHFIVSST